MAGVIESFVDDGVLHGKEVRVGCVHVFLYRPAKRAVVKDKVGAVLGRTGVFGLDVTGHIFLAYAESYVAHYEVLRAAKIHLVACDYDAVAGCCLSCKCPVRTVHAQFAREGDVTAHSKHYGDGLPLCCPKAQRSVPSPPSSASEVTVTTLPPRPPEANFPETFGRRKREHLCGVRGLDCGR